MEASTGQGDQVKGWKKTREGKQWGQARQEYMGGMANRKVVCAGKKHSGWQDSNDEAEAGRKRESEEEERNVGSCQPGLKRCQGREG